MIKKSIKSFKFINNLNLDDLEVFIDGNIHHAGHILMNDGVGIGWVDPNALDQVTITQVAQNFQINLPNRLEPQFTLDADGDARITGRMHALGSVIYDALEQRMKYWDGNQWLPI